MRINELKTWLGVGSILIIFLVQISVAENGKWIINIIYVKNLCLRFKTNTNENLFAKYL